MHAVCGYCSEDVLQAISDHGADVNDTNNENLSVLIMAFEVYQSCVNANNVLVESLADLDTAYVCGEGVSINKIQQTIINQCADVKTAGCTALMLACYKRNADGIQYH